MDTVLAVYLGMSAVTLMFINYNLSKIKDELVRHNNIQQGRK